MLDCILFLPCRPFYINSKEERLYERDLDAPEYSVDLSLFVKPLSSSLLFSWWVHLSIRSLQPVVSPVELSQLAMSMLYTTSLHKYYGEKTNKPCMKPHNYLWAIYWPLGTLHCNAINWMQINDDTVNITQGMMSTFLNYCPSMQPSFQSGFTTLRASSVGFQCFLYCYLRQTLNQGSRGLVKLDQWLEDIAPVISIKHISRLVQGRCKSSVLVMELYIPCTNPMDIRISKPLAWPGMTCGSTLKHMACSQLKYCNMPTYMAWKKIKKYAINKDHVMVLLYGPNIFQ